MKIGTIASTLVALSLGASLTACGGAELSDGSQILGDENASGEIQSDFESEFAQVGEEVTACDDQQYDHWRNLAALAVASANELGRWNAAKDFVKVQIGNNPGIALSSEGLSRCTNNCDNIKAILELQNEVTKIIPRHDPALLRQYMVTFFDRQVSWSKANTVPDHSLKLAAVSNDVCGFRYHFDVTGTTSTTTTTTTSGALSGTTELKPTHSYKCVDLAGGGVSDGATVQQYSCHGGNNQKFTLESQGNNAYRLKSVASGRCVGVVNSATNDGSKLEQRSCGANNSQTFNLNSKGNGNYEIKNVASGKCLDVVGPSTADSTPLQLYSCTGGTNQTFQMPGVSAGANTTTTTTTSGSAVNPSVLFNQLKFAGETDNKYLMFQSTSTQASIDPMATMINGGSTAKSGSCVEGATVYGDSSLLGDCCVVSGKYGTLAQTTWNTKVFYCK